MILNVAGEAADKAVEVVLETMTVIVKLTGKGVKEAIYIAQDINRNKLENASGRVKLEKMMKSCDSFEIFTLKQKHLEKFMQEAEKYGVLYCTILDSDNDPENSVDVFVRGTDAAKVDRLIKRYDIPMVDVANLRPESFIDKDGNQIPAEEMTEVPKTQEEKQNNVDNDLINSIMGEDVPVKEAQKQEKNERQEDGVSNDFLTVENPSEISSENKENDLINDGIQITQKKKSVRLDLEECAEEAKQNVIIKEEKEKGFFKKKGNKKKHLKGEKKNGKIKQRRMDKTK